MSKPELKEHDLVRVIVDGVNAMVGEKIPVGTIGTIISIYSGAKAFEVEFPVDDGANSIVVTCADFSIEAYNETT
jgi:hypothetical protein